MMNNNSVTLGQMVQHIKQNPMQILSKRFNLPEKLPRTPEEILQYLLNSGQVSQQQVNQAMQLKDQAAANNILNLPFFNRFGN